MYTVHSYSISNPISFICHSLLTLCRRHSGPSYHCLSPGPQHQPDWSPWPTVLHRTLLMGLKQKSIHLTLLFKATQKLLITLRSVFIFCGGEEVAQIEGIFISVVDNLKYMFREHKITRIFYHIILSSFGSKYCIEMKIQPYAAT